MTSKTKTTLLLAIALILPSCTRKPVHVPSDNPATTATPPTDPPQDDDIDILYDQLEYLGYTDLGDKKDFHSVMADQNNVVKAYNILKQEQDQGNYEGLCTLNEFKQYMSNAQKAYDQQRSLNQVRQQQQQASDRKKEGRTAVYICTGGFAHAYHDNPDCRGLRQCNRSVSTVTIQEAADDGYRPCAYCYR